MREVRYSREAVRTLRRMPANAANLIRSKIAQCAAEPNALANNVKALSGSGDLLRLRVGDWRVLFREDGLVLAIISVAPRGSAYE